MTLTINGQNKTFEAAAMTVAQAMAACGFPERGVAVAVDNKVVSRGAWGETRLSDGQTLTVIRAVCGG